MRMRNLLFFVGVATSVVVALACDKTNPDDFAGDAGNDGSSTPSANDAAVPDALADATDSDALVDGFLADGDGRCPGSSYTTMPDGGACDVRRILYVQGRGGHNQCFAPPVGTFCDSLIVSGFGLEAGTLPPGFVCSGSELGVATCHYELRDGSANGLLDDAAIAAACGATTALPASTVTCIVYD